MLCGLCLVHVDMNFKDIISKMYFSHLESPGVPERMQSVNLEASSSGENQTLGGHSGQPGSSWDL